MNRELTITDLTRMAAGHVCVAGYDRNGQAIRLAAPRLHELDIVAGTQPVAFPSAIVACDVQDHLPDPPHTEDYSFDPYSLQLIRRLEGTAWKTFLESQLFGSIADIFEQPITHDNGYYLPDGTGPRSIGTIRPKGIAQVAYTAGENPAWGYRLGFFDQAGQFYRLKITDLTCNAYCESLRAPDCEPQAIAARLTQILKSRLVYLRIGLSRKWVKNPGRCYLQLNGIYTFPDYLDGSTFADFRPPAR